MHSGTKQRNILQASEKNSRHAKLLVTKKIPAEKNCLSPPPPPPQQYSGPSLNSFMTTLFAYFHESGCESESEDNAQKRN